MKVLLISVRSDIGGGPKHVSELLHFLRSKNIESIVCSPLSEPFGPALKNLADHHIECPHRSFSISAFLAIFKFCKANPKIIIHSHGRGAGVYSKLLSLLGYTVIHTFHGVHRPKNLKDQIKGFIDRALSGRVHRFINVSPDERKLAIELGFTSSDRSMVILNQFVPAEEPIMKEPQSIRTLGSLSRLDPHKNNLHLVKCFKKLSQEDNQLQLIIGGDGEQREQISAYINKHELESKVHLLGEVHDHRTFFENIDLFVSASKGEGLPYSVLEAFGFAKPCLLSNVSGHNFLASKESLFDLEQEASFIDSFHKVQANKENIIKEQLLLIESKFSEEQTFQKLLGQYLNLGEGH